MFYDQTYKGWAIPELEFSYNITMDSALPMVVKVAIIHWDTILDRLEGVIKREECICCRGFLYYHILCEAGTLPSADTGFEQVDAALSHLLDRIRKLLPHCTVGKTNKKSYAIYRHKHRYAHKVDKAAKRELVDAETRLVVALHFHPLIRGEHQCSMNYWGAVRYGVEESGSDEVFLMDQTLKFTYIIGSIRNLFE